MRRLLFDGTVFVAESRRVMFEAELDYELSSSSLPETPYRGIVVHKDRPFERIFPFVPDQMPVPDGRQEVPRGSRIFCLLLAWKGVRQERPTSALA